MPHMAFDFLLLDLEIRDRRQHFRIPVDKALVLINQLFAIQLNEYFVHGALKSSSIVKRSRDQSQDAPRRRNCFVIVPPDCSFHSQTFFRKASRPISRRPTFCARRGQFALHHHLRRDAGMIGARLPQHIVAFHALIADENILQA